MIAMCPSSNASILFLLILIFGWQQEHASASAARHRGLKKGPSDKGPPVVDFELCAELIPAESPDPVQAVIFDLEDTCTTTFWGKQDPWNNGSPLYMAYYPVCSCVILAKDCFLPAVSTFAPMYDVARSTGMSKEVAIVFASPFVNKECLAYALAFLDQWDKQKQDDQTQSND